MVGKRIATSYDVIVRDYLAQHAIDAGVVRLDGAVESSIQLGVADAIADVVETGSTPGAPPAWRCVRRPAAGIGSRLDFTLG